MTHNTFRSGVYLPQFGPFGDPTVLVDLAVRAEAAGWDGVFLWDHVVSDELPIVDTWTTLAAIAQATSRILLGPMVTPLARRRPWIVARQASTVSRLSGGRLVLGVGLGSDESGDFSRFSEPVDPKVRASMLDESLDIMRAMWSGNPHHHNGTHYHVNLPRSAPEPHPIPIWAASSTNNPAVLRRAKTCDGIFPNPEDHTMSPEDVATVATALQPTGNFDIAVAGNASHAWEDPKNIDLTGLAKAGMTWWMESLIHFDPLELSLEVVDAGPPHTS
ncbi:LLM class flavin-dependent oxidoreductase [Umezawaea sp. Da 62-37]|uniref:LLM class flavin-dependent oxidoreductase n=1 Tax=Umezawaea sp. Da 62-37 TaxID=3075927 RepID=UPI0028F7197D|nr:LLM class flavin-dependent oxidoreductase [Umezawaea sp. Da 62-37]WNV89212.1 LLM class flavin-dependent oxidoreductase [Umezawaea sp. Da 62-37]